MSFCIPAKLHHFLCARRALHSFPVPLCITSQLYPFAPAEFRAPFLSGSPLVFQMKITLGSPNSWIPLFCFALDHSQGFQEFQNFLGIRKARWWPPGLISFCLAIYFQKLRMQVPNTLENKQKGKAMMAILNSGVIGTPDTWEILGNILFLYGFVYFLWFRHTGPGGIS